MDLEAMATEVEPSDWEGVHYSKSVAPDVWWRAHFSDAADAVIDFMGGDEISLRGRRVADIGCGDGIIDLGIALRAEPERLVGFDLSSTDTAELTRMAAERAGVTQLPANLFFATSGERTIPAEDDSFDYVISWSAFEHIADPVAILREIRRILTPRGCCSSSCGPSTPPRTAATWWTGSRTGSRSSATATRRSSGSCGRAATRRWPPR